MPVKCLGSEAVTLHAQSIQAAIKSASSLTDMFTDVLAINKRRPLFTVTKVKQSPVLYSLLLSMLLFFLCI